MLSAVTANPPPCPAASSDAVNACTPASTSGGRMDHLPGGGANDDGGCPLLTGWHECAVYHAAVDCSTRVGYVPLVDLQNLTIGLSRLSRQGGPGVAGTTVRFRSGGRSEGHVAAGGVELADEVAVCGPRRRCGARGSHPPRSS